MSWRIASARDGRRFAQRKSSMRFRSSAGIGMAIRSGSRRFLTMGLIMREASLPVNAPLAPSV